MLQSDDIYQDLPEQIREGNCVLVIGMGIYRGLSQTVAGLQLPDDTALARELAQGSAYPDEPTSLSKVAQYYEWKKSRNDLVSYIRERFEPFNTMHIPILGLVCRIPFKAIITTCVDNLLENEFLRQGKPYDKIVRNEDVSFLHSDRPLLIKLHGSLEDAGSLVLTEADYLDFFDKLPNVSNTAKTLCSSSTLLFLGFDLEDPNFKRLHREITSKIATFCRRAYAFDGDRSDYAIQWWQTQNVSVVRVQAMELLARLQKIVVQQPPVNLDYRDLQTASRFQLDQQLAELRRGKYDPTLYIPREEIEAKLQEFISNDKNGLILVGDSGTGKTNTLCQLAQKWTSEGHIVLYYDCGGSLDIDIEKAISRDLAPQESAPFDKLVEQFSAIAQAQSRRIIWLFDGINEFRDGENRAGELLKRLDVIVGRARGPELKLILTCRTATWENLTTLGRTNLFWRKYDPGSQQPLFLSTFNHLELEQAYTCYQQRFRVASNFTSLPEQARERMRDPLLLRMIAEAYSGKSLPVDILSLEVLQAYCSRQIKQPIRDMQFLGRLASCFLKQRVQALPLQMLLADPQLAPEISDDPYCAYQQLRDSGLLTVTTGPTEPLIKFTYDRTLEYFIARYWCSQIHDLSQLGEYLCEVLPEFTVYAPAWAAATIAVMMAGTEEALFRILVQLSSTWDYRTRQVAVDSLVSLHLDSAEKVQALLRRLICYRPKREPIGARLTAVESGMELPLRTALKTTRAIKTGINSVFLQAAASQDVAQRDIVANELYVLWQQEPDTGLSILREIIGAVRPQLSSKPLQLLDFAARFSLGLFSNYCHHEGTIQQLSDAWWDEFEARYKIDEWFGSGVVQRLLDTGIRMAAQRGIAGATMDAITLGGKISLDSFFTDIETRKRMKRLVDYLDPAMDITPALSDIMTVLSSDLIYPNTLAALILTVHTHKDFGTMCAVLNQMVEALPSSSRLWLLLSFMLLAPVEIPAKSATETVVSLTRRILEENREDFFRGPQGLFEHFDIGLLPLGLTYGKWGLEMGYLTELIEQGRGGDWPLLVRCVRGLAPVGLYYPDVVLELLSLALADGLDRPEMREVAVQTMATIGVIHNQKVEYQLLKMGMDERFRADVQAHEDASLVKHYVDAVGLYNVNAYGCLFYPRIRKLTQRGYQAASECQNLSELIACISQAYIQLVLESNYRIREMISRP